MKNQLSVIIPTLNNTKGLNYLLNFFKDQPYQIIVVDNKKYNRGFAGGVNFGVKQAKAPWLLILNDDIEFEIKIINNKLQITNKSQNLNIKYQKNSKSLTNNQQNIIKQLIKIAEENKYDAVTPILINPNGAIENVGYRVLPYGKIELVKNFPISNLQLLKIDGLTAACLLVRTSVFEKLNGFDESFFAYLEDVDFFLRFKKAGYKMGIAYDIKVLHNHMTTSKTMGNFKSRQDMINWWRLYIKHKDRFKFDFDFVVERLKNISGFIKASIKKVYNIS